MAKTLKLLPLIFITIVILASLGLSGCSGGTGTQTSTPAAQQPSSSSTPPSSGSGQSAAPTGQQQGSASSGQRGSRGPGGQNMSAVLNKAADILGISESTFTSAFNDARTSVFGSRPSDNRTGSGQPPQHPSGSDNWSGRGSRPPSGGSSGQQSAMMTKVYAQMATALNISADKISAAMQQASTELRGQTGTVQ
ncbi:MAG: hypothetical protein ABSF74_06945 [Dehalococcoidia bacterium]|jgi:hypothetical protein